MESIIIYVSNTVHDWSIILGYSADALETFVEVNLFETFSSFVHVCKDQSFS